MTPRTIRDGLEPPLDQPTEGPDPHPFDGRPMDPAATAAEPLPTVPGFPYLLPGNAAVIVGPTGAGRSSLVQACAYDAARQGVRVAYLGSEVTEPEFNARAADLAERRGDTITPTLREQLSHVRYLDLAAALAHAWQHPDEWTQEMAARFQVVAIDPLSAVAATLDLDFDKSNAEFVRFYVRLVQPLATAGCSIVLLDNVGHALEARGRAKGASAKQDVADLTFSCKLVAQPVGLAITAHKVRTVRAPFTRGDSWLFDRDTQRIERRDPQPVSADGGFRPTVLMERVSRAIEAEPGISRRALRDAVKGKHEHKLRALDILIAEGYVTPREDGTWPAHYSAKPYREGDETETGPRPAPNRSPGTTGTTGPPVPSLKDRGPGTTPDQAPAGRRARGTTS